MKALKYISRAVIWSAAVSVGLRVVFGLYSVFGAPVILIPVIAGIGAAFSFTPPGNAGFVAVSAFHMLLVTVFSILSDITGIFRSLAYGCANFFAETAGMGDVNFSIIHCMMYVTPIYFLSFILFSAFISRSRYRRKTSRRTAYDDEYTDNDSAVTVKR